MLLSRRGFLAGTSAALALPARAADIHVAVIGAGAAGLAATKRLAAAGARVTVIEARDRIGGRAVTATVGGARFDAGAVYIHWAERNPWVSIAKDLNVPLDDSDAPEQFVIVEDGKRVLPGAVRENEGGFAEFWRTADSLSGKDDVSFAEAVEAAGERAQRAAARITRGALGEEPERVSLADYQQLDSGDDMTVPSGYGALVARYGTDLPVTLRTAARAIRWGGEGVAIETSSGTLRVDATIVTVPVGVLLSEAIRFDPVLPAATRDAIGGLGMGAYTKIALAFEAGSRFDLPVDATLIARRKGGLSLTFDIWPSNEAVAVALLGGDQARGLIAEGERAAVNTALDYFVDAVGADARGHFLGGQLAAWWADPYARGSYSIARPGHAQARAALAEPVGDKLLFAGEATAGPGAMTVGGATLAGIAAADRVIALHHRG